MRGRTLPGGVVTDSYRWRRLKPPVRLPDYTEPSREDEPVTVCGVCGGDIYYGEPFGEKEGWAICKDCLEDKWRQLPYHQRLAMMGFRPVVGVHPARGRWSR